MFAQGKGVRHEGCNPELAARRRIDKLMAEEEPPSVSPRGGGWEGTDVLSAEFLPFILLVAAVYAEVHIVARTFYLQCFVQIGSRLDVVPRAFALAELAVDERVAQVGAWRCRGEEVVEQLMADLGGCREEARRAARGIAEIAVAGIRDCLRL